MTNQIRIDRDTNPFLRDVQHELVSAVAKHGGFRSLHEAYAVLLEEVDELWEICRQKQSDRDPRQLRAELVQIAAMAWKTARSFDLESLPDDEPR